MTKYICPHNVDNNLGDGNNRWASVHISSLLTNKVKFGNQHIVYDLNQMRWLIETDDGTRYSLVFSDTMDDKSIQSCKENFVMFGGYRLSSNLFYDTGNATTSYLNSFPLGTLDQHPGTNVDIDCHFMCSGYINNNISAMAFLYKYSTDAWFNRSAAPAVDKLRSCAGVSDIIYIVDVLGNFDYLYNVNTDIWSSQDCLVSCIDVETYRIVVTDGEHLLETGSRRNIYLIDIFTRTTEIFSSLTMTLYFCDILGGANPSIFLFLHRDKVNILDFTSKITHTATTNNTSYDRGCGFPCFNNARAYIAGGSSTVVECLDLNTLTCYETTSLPEVRKTSYAGYAQ